MRAREEHRVLRVTVAWNFVLLRGCRVLSFRKDKMKLVPPPFQERLTACTFQDSRPSTMCSSPDQIKDWVLLYSWPCFGLFPRITSICSSIPESSFGATSSAFMFSLTCSGRLAPVMTVLTFVFFRHQARAN